MAESAAVGAKQRSWVLTPVCLCGSQVCRFLPLPASSLALLLLPLCLLPASFFLLLFFEKEEESRKEKELKKKDGRGGIREMKQILLLTLPGLAFPSPLAPGKDAAPLGRAPDN